MLIDTFYADRCSMPTFAEGWYWTDDSDMAHGPFNTEEDALDNAKEESRPCSSR